MCPWFVAPQEDVESGAEAVAAALAFVHQPAAAVGQGLGIAAFGHEDDVVGLDGVALDEIVDPAGVKGIGEIGITGAAAAIANAVFNATGKRIRSLPITPDKLL